MIEACLCLLAIALAQPRVATQNAEQRFVLAGIRAGREALRSGVFRAQGRSASNRNDGEEVYADPVEVFAAFDFDRDLLRFDRAQQALRNEPWPAGKPAARYIRAPTESWHWTALDIYTLRRDRRGARPAQNLMRLDPRQCGLTTKDELEKGFEFSEIMDYLARPAAEVIEDEGAVVRITWVEFSNETHEFPTRRRIWVDRDRAYAPLRLELHLPARRDAHNALNDPNAWQSDPFAVSEVAWTKESGVWVPASLKMETRSVGSDSKFHWLSELSFAWESVNQPVDDRWFTVASMDLEDHVEVVDVSLGRPVQLGRIATMTDLVAEPRPVARRSRFGTAGLIGVVALAAIIGLAAWQRVRRRRLPT